ncbi:hypothetical protein ACJROX_13150 [Pseudalkalibacillus sp. A8]|uniref:hypothetical protein n=1 Tax=Pseudalkalibacillus sp. A8 TaxID=3382641 RepID=UPI0038B6436D
MYQVNELKRLVESPYVYDNNHNLVFNRVHIYSNTAINREVLVQATVTFNSNERYFHVIVNDPGFDMGIFSKYFKLKNVVQTNKSYTVYCVYLDDDVMD